MEAWIKLSLRSDTTWQCFPDVHSKLITNRLQQTICIVEGNIGIKHNLHVVCWIPSIGRAVLKSFDFNPIYWNFVTISRGFTTLVKFLAKFTRIFKQTQHEWSAFLSPLALSPICDFKELCRTQKLLSSKSFLKSRIFHFNKHQLRLSRRCSASSVLSKDNFLISAPQLSSCKEKVARCPLRGRCLLLHDSLTPYLN